MNDTRDLSRNLRDLLRREHAALADFLLALAAFDRERRWLELGYTSLFWFLHRELGLSKGAAFYRKTAAELVQRYPEVVDPLRDGRLCISSVVELAKVITPDNRGDVVARFFHASREEAKAVVAELRPAEVLPRRDVVTRARGATPAPANAMDERGADLPLSSGSTVEPSPAPLIHDSVVVPAVPAPPPPAAQNAPPPARDEVEPLTADLRRLHITVSKRFLAKLSAARDALSHSRPDASIEDVIEAALDLLLAKKDKARGLVENPRPALGRASDRPRHIPAAVRRAVWLRDGGRCQHPLASGGICGSTRRLELDHIVPVALGGKSTFDNLRVACHLQSPAQPDRGAARLRRRLDGPVRAGWAGASLRRDPAVASCVRMCPPGRM